ncbi:MAG: MATE family efflux transporter [Flavonifractor plautii]
MKRSFFQYVSLNVLGALGLSGYILADTLFVAHRLGTDGLAALNLAISVFGLINGLGLMLGIGGATRYAICRTQGDGVRADRAFSRALACGGTLGGLLALAGLLWAVPLARLLGAEGAILPMCSVYLRTVLLFAPCFLLNHILTAFVRNDGNPKLAMAAMLLGSLSNIVLDYVFLYPMDMGIFGAALATGIAPVVGLCVSSLHILTRRSRFRLRPFRPALRPLADLAGLGSAAFLNECSSGLVLVVFNLLTLRLAGTLGVAAYGIGQPGADGPRSLHRRQSGRPAPGQPGPRPGDAAGVRTLCRMALGLALCAGLCMAALAFFAAGPLVSLFNRDGDPALQQMAEQGLRLYFLGFPFAGLNLVTASFLGAAEHPSRSLRLSLLRGFVAIVAAALLLAALLGLTGVWLAFPAAEGAVLLVSLRLSRSLRRARPEPAPQAITTALR